MGIEPTLVVRDKRKQWPLPGSCLAAFLTDRFWRIVDCAGAGNGFVRQEYTMALRNARKQNGPRGAVCFDLMVALAARRRGLCGQVNSVA